MQEEKKQFVMTGEQLIGAYRNEQAKLEMLAQKMQQLQALSAEANNAEEAVNEIKKAEKNEKIIVDLGAGVYTEATIEGSEKFKNAFAGNIMVNSDSKKTLEYLKNESQMIRGEIEAVAKEHEKTLAALNEISGYLQIAERQAQERMAKAAKQKEQA